MKAGNNRDYTLRLRQHHLPVLMALAASNPDHPTLAVEIGDFEFRHFRYTEPCAVHRCQDRPVLEVPWCFKQGLNFGFAENDRQLLLLARQRNPVDLDSAAQSVLTEEPKYADGLNVSGELYPFLIEQE